MRSMVEGLSAPVCPSTALRAVPLPIRCADREERALASSPPRPHLLAHDPSLHPRSRPHRRRRQRRAGAAQCARPRPACGERWAIGASGWPSIIRCRASPAPPPRWRSPMSATAPRRSGSARAGSCCPTMRRCRSPSSSGRSNRCSRAGSTSASAARRAPTRPPLMPSAATSSADVNQFPRDVVELMEYLQPDAAPPGARHPRRGAQRSRSGSSARACSAPSSPPISACPTPSPRISRRRR
jgi:hypothetical protein